MPKKLLIIISLCVTLMLHATPGATAEPIDTTTLHEISYEYDKLNRVTKATYASGKSIAYSYDVGGNLLEVKFDDPNEVEKPNLAFYKDELWDDVIVINDYPPTPPSEKIREHNSTNVFDDELVYAATYSFYSATFDQSFSNQVSVYIDGNYISSSGGYVIDPFNNYRFYIYGFITLSPGKHGIKLVLDPDDIVDESNENDNVLEKTFYVMSRDGDSDNDGIKDTDEGIIDTDGDGTVNFLDTDSDDDGISDELENINGLNPLDNIDGADIDSDGDGYSNLMEIEAGTDMNSTDSKPKSLESVTVEKIGEYQDTDYISFVVEDTTAYVLTNKGLKILDISKDDEIQLVSELLLDGNKHKIVQQGQYLYIANSDKGVRIIDISDKTDPKIVGTFYTGTDSWTGWADDIDVQGNLAYIAYNGAGALNVVDISDKTAPKLLSKYSSAGMTLVKVSGEYIFAENFGGARGISILELGSDNKLNLIGKYDESTTDADIVDIKVKGNYAYVLINNIGVRILSIEDKSNPRVIGTIEETGNSLEMYAQYLFITSNGSKGTSIVDISDNSNPKILANFHPYKQAEELEIQGNNLYVIGRSEGLKVFTTTPTLFGADSILDSDGDGYNDDVDIFPSDVNEWLDTDSDGTGNNADMDDDGDGVNDTQDAFPLDSSESLDTDGDGTGNNKDYDDDNDGISDTKEIENGLDPLNSSDAILDNDGDGLSNIYEINNDTDVNEADSIIAQETITDGISSFITNLTGYANASGDKLLEVNKDENSKIEYKFAIGEQTTEIISTQKGTRAEIRINKEDTIILPTQKEIYFNIDYEGNVDSYIEGGVAPTSRLPLGTTINIDSNYIRFSIPMQDKLEF